MTNRKLKTLKAWALAGGAMIALTGGAFAQETKKIEFDIAAQDLGEALTEFGVQSGADVLFKDSDIRGKLTDGVTGAYTTDQAIEVLLDESGVKYLRNDSGTLLVGETYIRQSELRDGRFRVAQLDQEDSADVATASNRNDRGDELTRDEIIVTGTNIRGIAPDSSPSFSFDRDDIAQTGATTTQAFIQTLTPNFAGGANEFSLGAPNDNASQENLGFGSSVNLRGLGSGSTLVLVNGNRLAPSSGIGDFVDISMIPLSAIERVEVLTDGASSIYGGDAVAGVVNFILREDFEGAETLVQFGSVTEGELKEYRVGQSFGHRWNTGNAMVSYEFLDRGNLPAEDREFTAGANSPFDLLPEQTRHSVFANVNQELTDGIELSVDALYSDRDTLKFTTATAGNTLRDEINNEQYAINGGLEVSLFSDWVLETVGSYSKVNIFQDRSINNVNQRDIDSSQWSINGSASGSLFEAFGGSVKTAIGVQYRDEQFSNFDVDQGAIDRDAERDVFAAFGELFIPLVSESNRVSGVERLEVNVSGRYEDYSDFGDTFNPKVGLLWSPVNGLNLRGSYGTSFNPPDLGRVGAVDTVVNAFTNDITNSFFNFGVEVPNSDVALLRQGTSDSLEAEESETWTAGFDINANSAYGEFSLSGTYFDIEFDGRINDPVVPGGLFNVLNLFLSGSNQVPDGLVVQNPAGAEVSSLISLAQTQSGFNDFFGVFTGPDNVGFIVNFVDDNRAKTNVNGFEVDGRFQTETSYGDLWFSLTGTYIAEFSTQNDANTPAVDVVDTVFNPAELKLRGGAGWSLNGWNVSTFVNHVGAYEDIRPDPAVRVDAFTTVDLTASYSFSDDNQSGLLSGVRLAATVSNLFDENPPSIQSEPSFGVLGFDPTNASALGRFITVQLVKQW